MTKRVKELIGKPVISAEGGEKLGTVTDLLIDDVGHELVGVVVAHGLMRNEEVLPAEAVQSFGRDAVVSRSAELIAAKDWRESHDKDYRESHDKDWRESHDTSTRPPERFEPPRR